MNSNYYAGMVSQSYMRIENEVSNKSDWSQTEKAGAQLAEEPPTFFAQPTDMKRKHKEIQ